MGVVAHPPIIELTHATATAGKIILLNMIALVLSVAGKARRLWNKR
jgi:hypothetical protein